MFGVPLRPLCPSAIGWTTSSIIVNEIIANSRSHSSDSLAFVIALGRTLSRSTIELTIVVILCSKNDVMCVISSTPTILYSYLLPTIATPTEVLHPRR